MLKPKSIEDVQKQRAHASHLINAPKANELV